jgi:NAD(P)-dependent dehydrogenase (short-subunit alcohol dehydrogenase family)
MADRFADKVALVTGGGSGIGRAIALGFAAEGATAVVAGRSQETLDETVALIESAGGAASAQVTDVSKADDVESLIATIKERHGGLHIACNNAGTVGKGGPVDELEEDVWDEVLAINLTGTWLCMKHEIAWMREQGSGGSIVNVSSNIGAHVIRPRMGAYAASKAGVNALTRVAALDCIEDGIRVNAVSPGATDTPLSFRPGETHEDRAKRIDAAIPMHRLGTVEEMAAAVLWTASSDAEFVVGQDFVIDGGASV